MRCHCYPDTYKKPHAYAEKKTKRGKWLAAHKPTVTKLMNNGGLPKHANMQHNEKPA